MSSQGKVFESYWCVCQGWNSFPFKEVWDIRWKTLKSYKVDLVLNRVQHSPLIGWFPVAKIHISLQTTTWESTWILKGMGPGKDPSMGRAHRKCPIKHQISHVPLSQLHSINLQFMYNWQIMKMYRPIHRKSSAPGGKADPSWEMPTAKWKQQSFAGHLLCLTPPHPPTPRWLLSSMSQIRNPEVSNLPNVTQWVDPLRPEAGLLITVLLMQLMRPVLHSLGTFHTQSGSFQTALLNLQRELELDRQGHYLLGQFQVLTTLIWAECVRTTINKNTK